MKIIAIGRNYADHAKEMKSELPENPIFFCKADSCLVHNNKPFFYPDFSNEIHYEAEIVVKINRLGKFIEKEFAQRYYDEITIGIDFTARDKQRECKKKGLPWEIAKSFDASAPVGKFISKTNFKTIDNLPFFLDINNQPAQRGNTKDMIFSIDELIAYVSRFFTLKIGDLIFTGTPAGVGPVQIKDHLKAGIADKILLEFDVK